MPSTGNFPSQWSKWEWNDAYACESRYRIIDNKGIPDKDYEFQYRGAEERGGSARQRSRPATASASALPSINETSTPQYYAPSATSTSPPDDYTVDTLAGAFTQTGLNSNAGVRRNTSTSRPANKDRSASKSLETWPPREDIPNRDIRARDPEKGEEDLDPNYKKHNSTEFTFGRVFKILWTEPKGSGGTEITGAGVRKTKYGEESYTTIRRFVIVRPFEGHSICLPILTYGGQATLKKGVKYEFHCVIYTDKPIMKPKERITKQSIRMVPDNPRFKLDPASRMNYAKVYTVEHNTKVQFIGRISSKYTQQLADDYNRVHQPISDLGTSRQQPGQATYNYAQGGSTQSSSYQVTSSSSYTVPVASGSQYPTLPAYQPAPNPRTYENTYPQSTYPSSSSQMSPRPGYSVPYYPPRTETPPVQQPPREHEYDPDLYDDN